MKQSQIIYWTPRILTMAFAAFLSIFTLDIFSEPFSLFGKAVALFMHLIPSMMVVAILAVIWRHEWLGAIFFPLLAALHVSSMWHRPLHWSAYAIIDGPLLLLAVLFLLNWINRRLTPHTHVRVATSPSPASATRRFRHGVKT